MENISTPNELLEAFKAIGRPSEETPKQYRYAIYARKSTDEEKKQIRSLDDQVMECLEFAETNNLKVVETIREAESAKEPDIRKHFRQMLNDLNAGKYDGIISWHPDRLARNMKDAGEIIDLVDKEIIKDLKFVSFTFQNDTSGKMLLGITFVLSKEYSDKLSDNVSRGNKRSIWEGKYINKTKHGYYKDINQRLRPDNDTYNLIKNAFLMRLDGKTLDEIAQYLNANNYSRSNKKGGKKFWKMDKQKMQKIFKDPVYTGILKYGKNEAINLMELYDFIPMVTVSDFMTINKLSKDSEIIKLAKSYRKNEDVKANLMRQMVICGDCGEETASTITPKKNDNGTVTNYFYYRCETDDCPRKGKSTRAKVVLNFIYDFLESKPFSSKETYGHYVQEIKIVSNQRIAEAKTLAFSLQSNKTRLEQRQVRINELILSDENEETKEYGRKELLSIKPELAEVDKQLLKTRDFIENSKLTILTYADFLELMENMPKNLRLMTNMAELDYILRKMFLNFTVKDKKVCEYTLKSPFDVLDTTKVSICAR